MLRDKRNAPTKLGQTDEEWLTPSDVAKLYGVTKQTVYNWNKGGILSFQKIGGRLRLHRDDLPALPETQKKTTDPSQNAPSPKSPNSSKHLDVYKAAYEEGLRSGFEIGFELGKRHNETKEPIKPELLDLPWFRANAPPKDDDEIDEELKEWRRQQESITPDEPSP